MDYAGLSGLSLESMDYNAWKVPVTRTSLSTALKIMNVTPRTRPGSELNM